MSEGLTEAPVQSVIADSDLPDFRLVFETAARPMLIIAADARYTMVAVNEAHARAFRTTPAALTGWGVLEVFGQEGSAEVMTFVEAVRTSLDRVIATGAPDQMATRAYSVLAEDGSSQQRYWSATNTPVLGPDGAVTHIVSAVQDVTGEVFERRSEQARQLLMREVDHRARNALTVVQSMVRLTQADDLPDFRTVLDGRVSALARAQTSLAARRWEGADLEAILVAELAAMSPTGRYELKGRSTHLTPEQVQVISMAVHELATNAAKYGALSAQDGALRVQWSEDATGVLTLDWAETGGPPVDAPPVRQGFGSRLIARLIASLGGEAIFGWERSGLRVTLRWPLSGADADPDLAAIGEEN